MSIIEAQITKDLNELKLIHIAGWQDCDITVITHKEPYVKAVATRTHSAEKLVFVRMSSGKATIIRAGKGDHQEYDSPKVLKIFRPKNVRVFIGSKLPKELLKLAGQASQVVAPFNF